MMFVRTVELPQSVRGITLPNDDGTFSVYINSRLSQEQQRKVLAHEAAHVDGGHFYQPEQSLLQAEAEADNAPELPAATEMGEDLSQDGFLFAREPTGALTPAQMDALIRLLKNLP